MAEPRLPAGLPGERVVFEGTLTGTHTGIFREHLYFDQLEFLQQIGALPTR